MAEGKGDDGVFVFLFLVALLWGGGFLMWKGFRPQLTEGILQVRKVEIAVASIWTSDDKKIRVPMSSGYADNKGGGTFRPALGGDVNKTHIDTTFGVWREYVKNVKAKDVQTDNIRVLSYVALYPYRIPMAAILIGLFFWAVFTGPTSKFRRILGLEELIADQSKMFKVIKPFVTFNPNKLPVRAPGAPVPNELPMFAEALAPEEWLALYGVAITDGKLDRAAAESAFAEQLGPRWKGHKDLAPELQVLLASFCLKASRKREQADEMLGRLASCWDHKTGLKLSRDGGLVRAARKILGDKKLSEKVLGNCSRHAYLSTAMIRGLNTAREEGGVLAAAQFVWLRAHNRELWYPLNNLGRQAFHMEALGAFSHYRSEKQVNRPIPRPRMGDAIDGLAEFIKNPILMRPLPPVEGGRKRRRNNTPQTSKAA